MTETATIHADDDQDHKSAPKFAVLVWFNGDWRPLSYRYWTIAEAEKAIEFERADNNPSLFRATRIHD